MSEFVWWKHGVIYQIYPRSFRDSNSDGVGDIRGITDSIDYIAELGVDAIWISPVNKSPMLDFGYDIEDYREIDPLFGTMDDFLDLMKQCHDRNIRVIMDLVVNHTSDRHNWFLESRSSRNNPKRDWYIWHPGSGTRPPNRWKSAFGGSAWEFDERTGEYYLHSFLKEQPDLNWRNPELKKAVFDMMSFWLDLGVDGFRLDVVNWFIKDKKLRDNPVTMRPFHPERHKYDRNRPEVHDLLREMRVMTDRYRDRMLVGEVFTLIPGDPELSARFIGNGMDQLHMAFDFSIIYRFWSARGFYRALKKWYRAIPAGGWPAIVLSNHDQPRGRSRYLGPPGSDARARVASVFLLTVRGTPFLYYGEELGMKNARLRKSDIVDPLGHKFWPIYKGRDLSRGPMPWDGSENGGFSPVNPWLPADPDCENISVLKQSSDPYSMLTMHRRIISLRKQYRELSMGDFIPVLKGWRGIIAYYRKYGSDTSFIALNFTASEKKIDLNHRGQWRVLFSTHRTSYKFFTDLKFRLHPNEAIIVKRIGDM